MLLCFLATYLAYLHLYSAEQIIPELLVASILSQWAVVLHAHEPN